MIKTAHIFLLLWTSFIYSAKAEVASSNYNLWAEVLYPETKSWRDFDSLPEANFEKAHIKKDELIKSFMANRLERTVGGNCNEIKEVLNSKVPFRIIDINLDGIDDLIYSGPAGCGLEGDISFSWLGTKDGFKFETFLGGRPKFLKVKPGKDYEIVAVEKGCCADPIDKYVKRSPNYEPRILLFKNTFFAKKGLSTPKKFTTSQELIIRSSMEVNDAYDVGQSSVLETAVLGNILGKYMSGAAGKILAEATSESHQKWVFVSMAGAEHLRHYSIERANVGWVLESQLLETKKSKK